jgi:hypothetical protein
VSLHQFNLIDQHGAQFFGRADVATKLSDGICRWGVRFSAVIWHVAEARSVVP